MDNNNVQNVTAGKPFEGGAVFYAPLGTTLPTDALSELDAAFENVGYISEDGVVNTNTPSTQNTKAWGGDIVLNTVTEKPDNFKMTFLEVTNVKALKALYGDTNVSGDLATGITVHANTKDTPELIWVIDMMYKNGIRKRTVIPDAACVLNGDITYTDGSAVGFPINLTAYPDSNGDTHRDYIKNGVSA